MAYISQSKAAKLAGVSRGTIANRIDDGKLSRSPNGIDIADLVRVFPDITSDRIERFLAGELPPKNSDKPPVSDEVAAANARAAELLARTEELEAEKAAANEQRLAANSWAKGLADQMLEHQNKLIQAQAEQLAEQQAALKAKDQAIEALTHKITGLLPTPKPKRQKFLGIF